MTGGGNGNVLWDGLPRNEGGGEEGTETLT